MYTKINHISSLLTMNLTHLDHPLYVALHNNDVNIISQWLKSNNLRLTKFVPQLFTVAAKSGHCEGAVLLLEKLAYFTSIDQKKIDILFKAASEYNNGQIFRALFDKYEAQISSGLNQKFFQNALDKGNADIVCETANSIYSSIFLDRFLKALRTEPGRHCIREYLTEEVGRSRVHRDNRFGLFLGEILRRRDPEQNLIFILNDARDFSKRFEIFIGYLHPSQWGYLNIVADAVDYTLVEKAVRDYQKGSNNKTRFEDWLSERSKQRILQELAPVAAPSTKRKM